MTAVLTAGLSLKPQHYQAALNHAADGLWFEVHPENYMVEGGPRVRWLEAIRTRHPVSLHGVALSLAADSDPDQAHLARFAELARRVQPVLISEHLAWSVWRGSYYPDLLPFPRTDETLTRVTGNIARTQDALRRTIAIENPSHYVSIEGHGWDEIAFLCEIARRTGCTLLLDVNNVHVSAHNMGYSAEEYLDAFPAALISEVHLAGHTQDSQLGDRLLIDSHDAPVASAVWALYRRLIARIGPRPTLIERDGNVPPFDTLLGERKYAENMLRQPMAEAA
jgi:uncharacterized protein (UPF0276 family)